MRIFYSALLALALVPLGLAAQQETFVQPEKLTIETAPVSQSFTFECRFTTECYEAEPCADTEFTPSLEARAGGLTEDDTVVEAKLVSDAGDAVLLGVRSGGTLSLSGGTFEARQLLTIAKDGAARYSLHYADGPMAISYLGVCK
ncbi:hypothetical protein [Planktotalea sp.]|uniref:hypothetical protein n=1 Tax=Planktotalea sp. TaxID=2029877 RepID=UPI003D6C052E